MKQVKQVKQVEQVKQVMRKAMQRRAFDAQACDRERSLNAVWDMYINIHMGVEGLIKLGMGAMEL